MTGFRYARLHAGLTQKEISEKTQIHPCEVWAIDKGKVIPRAQDIYLKWSLACGCIIDDLMKSHEDDHELHIKCAMKGSEGNIVYAYCRDKRLTCRALGDILNISHELARQICMADNVEDKYILILAKCEKLSVKKFENKYGQKQ